MIKKIKRLKRLKKFNRIRTHHILIFLLAAMVPITASVTPIPKELIGNNLKDYQQSWDDSKGQSTSDSDRLAIAEKDADKNNQSQGEKTKTNEPLDLIKSSDLTEDNLTILHENIKESFVSIQNLSTISVNDKVDKEIRELINQCTEKHSLIIDKTKIISSRHWFIKFLIGPDFKNLKLLKQYSRQIEKRPKQLNIIKAQISNVNYLALLDKVIDSLKNTQKNLQDYISVEERSFSLFGWVFRIIDNY